MRFSLGVWDSTEHGTAPRRGLQTKINHRAHKEHREKKQKKETKNEEKEKEKVSTGSFFPPSLLRGLCALCG
jgi:hypothetical protein